MAESAEKQNKLFNLINWTTFSGPIKWNTISLWLNKLYQHLEDYVSHNNNTKFTTK